LGLIRLEFAVEAEKIGVTMPILASPPERDKPKLLDQRATSFGESITAFENIEELALFNRNDYMDNIVGRF
jgi:hypothetical protein